MNYANMIEEKHLKKGFIVATLISTIVGTLTTSMTLHDKVQEKRDKKKQKALDAKQTGEIEKLRKRVDALKSGHESDDETESNSSRSKSRSRRPRRRSLEEDDFVYESRRSRAMIERMYEDHLMRAGDRYATGDILTENRLQKQLIQLQQTVINVLQEALYSGRGLTETDQRRLIAAQSAARDGSLDALEDHYNRLPARTRREILPNNPTPRLLLPATSPTTDDPSTHALPSKPSPAPTTTRRPYRPSHPTTPPYSPDPTLFCPYSIHLQSTSQPLSPPPPSSTTSPPSLTCPTCQFQIPVSAREYWILSTTSTGSSTSSAPDEDEDDDFIPLPLPPLAEAGQDHAMIEEGSLRRRQGREQGGREQRREWKLTARFLVKCHTPEGEFACLFCQREDGGRRRYVCVARSVEGLVGHLGEGGVVIGGGGGVGRRWECGKEVGMWEGGKDGGGKDEGEGLEIVGM